MMGQVLFVVWRESVEALLVVGIVYTWLRAHPEAAAGRWYLWGGVVAGVATAVVLGAALLSFTGFFSGSAQDYVQLGMLLAAAALIVQMVFWMRRHGRTLKRELESGLSARAEVANWWGLLLVVALAIAREGSETVIFLYGLGSAQTHATLPGFVGSAIAGFALAFLTFWLLQMGGRILSWRRFFRISETLLLLLAGSLLISGVERMISFGWLPGLVDPLWDSSRWLDDSTAFGGLIAALTGYRAHPALTMLLALAGYWALVAWGLRRVSTPQPLTVQSPHI